MLVNFLGMLTECPIKESCSTKCTGKCTRLETFEEDMKQDGLDSILEDKE